MDNEPGVEETPPERTVHTVLLEAIEMEDGTSVVPAEGSVWQLYFPAGKTPTEDQFRVAVGGLGAVKLMQAGNVAYTGWDGAADGVSTDIVNFSGLSVIDSAARQDTVTNALRADVFNERVETEAARIVEGKLLALEVAATDLINQAEARRDDAESSALAATAAYNATVAEVERLRAQIEGGYENSVLPSTEDPVSVVGEGAVMNVTVTSDSDTSKKESA